MSGHCVQRHFNRKGWEVEKAKKNFVRNSCTQDRGIRTPVYARNANKITALQIMLQLPLFLSTEEVARRFAPRDSFSRLPLRLEWCRTAASSNVEYDLPPYSCIQAIHSSNWKVVAFSRDIRRVVREQSKSRRSMFRCNRAT
jgi:hypothetical protein